MTHRNIQNRLLLYLDDELPDRERADIACHLAQCSPCRSYLAELKRLWETEPAHRTPPSYLWKNVQTVIRGHAPGRTRPTGVGRLFPLLRPALMTAALIVGIAIGTYIGNLPETVASSENPVVSAEAGEILNASYLENFQDIPPESVDGIYLTGAVDE
ncbi:MAG: zf-HC2 domain-containing protein [candidate division Zixibacteria bacterium]|nr:zf-HC2 domain-containing protein [candidate division Zixibacteria bacterium]